MKKFTNLAAELNSGNPAELASTVNLTPRKLKRSRGKGFTLAEILITLTVIGVVAALTIPTLLQNTNLAELKTAWKKSYADMSQAVMQMVNDNGGDLSNAYADSNAFKNALTGKLSYIKTCNTYESGCWHSDNNWYGLSGAPRSLGFSMTGIITSDGKLIAMTYDTPACTGLWGYCGYVNVDVNGFKKPNTVGKDIFGLKVYKDKILPTGTQGDYHYNHPDLYSCDIKTYPGTAGANCSAEYLYQ